MSFFSDTETSVGNTFTAGTIDIAIDDQLHWSKNFEWNEIEPGNDFAISFNITNAGTNPLKLWQITKCLVADENGIIEPEQEWYDDNNGGNPKNDIDSAIVYQLLVDGKIAVSEKAGITMDKIKDNHVGLVKLDQPFAAGNGDGILQPGQSILIEQKYQMKEGTENWAQSDKLTFAIEIEARQTDTPEPLRQMVFMENKLVSGDWSVIDDSRMGILKYDYMAPTFNYDFYGVGLDPNLEYCLIYYADPGAGNHPGYFFNSAKPTSDGDLTLSGQAGIGIDLPHPDDQNYPNAAKIWLVNCNSYNKITYSLSAWDMGNWVFENWPGLINYRQGGRPNEELNCEYDTVEPEPLVTKNILIDDVISATDWTRETRDYSVADVEFSYQNPGTSGRLAGNISATGLKPYTTYQLKFLGKPTCEYLSDGNDEANEYIGYEGRWTVRDVPCSGSGCNRSDAQYESNTECIAGYLVWGFFTTDGFGNAVKAVSTANSYHVLRCNGGSCGLNNDSELQNTSGALDPGYPFCAAGDVGGELEPGRAPCGGLYLETGTYDLKMVLTEESFHQSAFGEWTSVLEKDISFEIE